MAARQAHHHLAKKITAITVIVVVTAVAISIEWPRLLPKQIGFWAPIEPTDNTPTPTFTPKMAPKPSAAADARRACLDRMEQLRKTSETNSSPITHADNAPSTISSTKSHAHWAFIPPSTVRPPVVLESNWSLGPVDDFVLDRLAGEKLSHSFAAERETLIRRLSLDLTGLPPDLEDVEQFVADTSPDAYERLLDRLLESPHYGEKWAIRWLDLARFADTNGFELDAVRTMWLYRDWVIESFNRDLPFDQFTVEQLAGDLLPNSSIQQCVATGFLRNSAVATDILTHRFEMLVDRVNTLGTTWLGMTFSCAQCHDHKFDPITQKDFYRLYAIFNNSADEVTDIRYMGASRDTESPLNDQIGSTLVVAERDKPIDSFLMVRGSPTAKGEKVEPGVPSFLHLPQCGESDRLSLACWLIDKNNPLTARVAVNRMWEAVFGAGLVRTSDDFGVRGDKPSHPELLDWLALEFQRNGWSNKRLLRQIVTSSTYRQSARTTPDLLERDPHNRLLTRGPRVRVDAELIRDIALTASDLLSRRLGGPSVFPWQPPGTSEKTEFSSFPWKPSTDDNRYRRGLYTHWKRTALYPSFLVFDAPNRTNTCARRINSTTPLQALVTLNDPVYFEAAIHLGRRMLEHQPDSMEAAITRGFRYCLSRQPTSDELTALVLLCREEDQRFRSDLEAAKKLIGGDETISRFPDLNVSSWAAYATVANVLLNLDETITKE